MTELTSLRDTVVILDAGAQYGKVIDRRVLEMSVETHMRPLNTPACNLKQYGGIIISGGPGSVYADDAPAFDTTILDLGVPVLGICYGMQLINMHSGGKVAAQGVREDGVFPVKVVAGHPLWNDLPEVSDMLLTHGDAVESCGNGLVPTAWCGDRLVAIANESKKLFGVQFHPEVDLTVHGLTIIQNFLITICGISPSYSIGCRHEKAIIEIKQVVKNRKVLVLVSGGVDSSVCAALLREVIPEDQLFALHVDTGFMRLRESEAVLESLKAVGVSLRVTDATDLFANSTTMLDGNQTPALKDATNPEVKRKIIGDTFMEVSEKEITALGFDFDEMVLAQGTLRPDLIESASALVSTNANVIKTHHNDTPLVRRLRDMGRIVEPLKDYHKDEVRILGEMLGLSSELVWRQPFPGPGLACRILCSSTPYVCDNAAELNLALDKLALPNTSIKVLPFRSVGVRGDGRSYCAVAGVFCKGKPDWKALFSQTQDIPARFHMINRVAYIFPRSRTIVENLDEVSNMVDTITPTYLRPDAIHKLRIADAIVNRHLMENNLLKILAQVPVILAPGDFGRPGEHTIVLRPFVTNDFMTGVAAFPGKHISEEMYDIIRNIELMVSLE